MKLTLVMLAFGASLLVLAGCSMAEAAEAVRAGTEVFVPSASTRRAAQVARAQAAVAEGAPVVDEALGLVVEAMQAIDTEATRRIAEEAAKVQELSGEVATRVTTSEAVLLASGTGLVGGGAGTGASRMLSKMKHGK